jgi:two-component system chemotaxis response regulator CheB
LEIDLPRMDGISFLRELMGYHPMPVLVVTSVLQGGGLACAALAAGAVDVVHKPGTADALKNLASRLGALIKAAAQTDVFARTQRIQRPAEPRAPGRPNDPMIAIGSSPGGTTALEYVLSRMPADGPGTVVAQQLPVELVREFTERVNQISSMEIRVAEDGDPIAPGLVLVSPGDSHIVVRRSEDHNVISLKPGPLVDRQRPSMDLLFLSVAAMCAASGTGVVLAGMSRDGIQGLLEIQRAGGTTLAQGEAFPLGTPKAAIESGVIDRVVTIEQMTDEILRVSARSTGGVPNGLMD